MQQHSPPFEKHDPRPRIDVVAGIIWSQGRYLGVCRPPEKPMAGYWEFPGGKVEQDEPLEEALVRELQEELGLTPTRFRYWREAEHDYEHLHVRLHFFHVAEWSGGPHPLEGHELCWLLPQEAANLPFLEADQAIVALLAQGAA